MHVLSTVLGIFLVPIFAQFVTATDLAHASDSHQPTPAETNPPRLATQRNGDGRSRDRG